MGKEITGRDDSNSFFLEFVKFIICIMLSPPITEYHSLGVVHNCHHFHERTQRTLGGGRGSRAFVRFFKCRLQ